MNVIFILIGFSLFVAIGFLIAFIWSVRSGQYEDDYTPSVRILFDDDLPSGDIESQQPAADEKTGKDSNSKEIKPKT